MKKVLILQTYDGYEALYINDQLIDQGNELGEGNSKLYMLKASEEYDFTSKDIKIVNLTEKDNDQVSSYGYFPSKLSGLSGKY